MKFTHTLGLPRLSDTHSKRSILMALVIAILFSTIALLPMSSFAASPLPATIIPCGNSNYSGLNGDKTNPCTFQDLLTFVKNFINFALIIMVAIATLAILYAGFLYLTSGAAPEQRSQAKGMFWKIGEAFFWVVIAYLLVKFIVVGLVDPAVSSQIFK